MPAEPSEIAVGCLGWYKPISLPLGESKGGRNSPLRFTHRRTADLSLLERLHNHAQVVTHQIQHCSGKLMVAVKLRKVATARVDRDLGRRQSEDQPASSGVDCAKVQDIAKELPIAFGVGAVKKKMSSRNHRRFIPLLFAAASQASQVIRSMLPESETRGKRLSLCGRAAGHGITDVLATNRCSLFL